MASKRMAIVNAELLKRLVRAAIDGDDRGVIVALRQIVSAERRQGHLRLADDLAALAAKRKGITNAQAHSVPAAPTTSTVVLQGRGSRDPHTLIEIRQGDHRFDDLILAHETETQIRRVLAEHSNRDRLSQYGLRAKTKLLFFGPPGNGKTISAHALAAELAIPLFYVRFDGLIASYLGETSANLRKVFDFATSHPGVLLFDEFDTIGKTRDDPREVGELKRVVNSFLQMLDGYRGASPVIAATNYERHLDYALWRRFDALIHFPPPDDAQIERYLRVRLTALRHSGFDTSDAAQICTGMSYADVTRALTEAIKSMVLSGETTFTIELFKREVEQIRRARTLTTAGQGG